MKTSTEGRKALHLTYDSMNLKRGMHMDEKQGGNVEERYFNWQVVVVALGFSLLGWCIVAGMFFWVKS